MRPRSVPFRSLRSLLPALAVLVTLLGGCGQSGDLYLPDKAPPTAAPTAAPTSEDEEKKKKKEEAEDAASPAPPATTLPPSNTPTTP